MADTAKDFREAVRGNILRRNMALTSKQTKAVTEAVWEEVVDHVLANGKLSVRGFGTFRLVVRPKRLTRNPKTGEKYKRGADATMKFRFRGKLK